MKHCNSVLLKIVVCFICLLLLAGCKPETPVTSKILVSTEGMPVLVNKTLYGLTVEGINHAIDGGLYAELIRNRSFEESVLPIHCGYDASRNVLITPNNFVFPFMRPDAIPGWHCISGNTYVQLDEADPINEKNRRSLRVVVDNGLGGVVAEGYEGISVRKGEKYNLSFFAKCGSMVPKTLQISLADSAESNSLSNAFKVPLTNEWKRYHHILVANDDTDNAVLTIETADSTAVFWLDMVSLFPEQTWHGRSNGQRSDLMEKIATLNPAFIRFPGGSFVEGYTTGTYPMWRDMIGDVSERRNFWNIWGYGSTSGMGFYEYLQMCEDLKAEPVYVVNSGITSQAHHPRYEAVLEMSGYIQDVLNAIAYANAPVDSTMGAMRAKQGHPEPFHLKYIEIGSENYGPEYEKRFELFYKAIKAAYPEISVISSAPLEELQYNAWEDYHIYSGEPFFLSNYNRFDSVKQGDRQSGIFIGEFGTVQQPYQGTLRAAVSEACFLIGAEKHPDIVKGVAYAPLLGNAAYEYQRPPLIAFDKRQIVLTPSYYLFEMFAGYRGDEVMQTTVDTYQRPQVTSGSIVIEAVEKGYEIKEAVINNTFVREALTQNGIRKVNTGGYLMADSIPDNKVVIGDSSAYNYEFSATIRHTHGNTPVLFCLRDNGQKDGEHNYIGLSIGNEASELYHQVGIMKDPLASEVPFLWENNRWYHLRIVCENEWIRCYVDNRLLHEVKLKPIPSLVSIATLDKKTNTLLLKVVNTTQHEEKTELVLDGMKVNNHVEVLQLTGHPDACNTFTHPDMVKPTGKSISFSLGRAMVYKFPPNSITILQLKVEGD